MKNKKPWLCLDCRVVMLQVNEDYCKCPICGTEVWHDYNNEKLTVDYVKELMEDNLITHQRTVYDAMIGGKPIKGSSSNNAKSRGKKQAMKKPSANELYNRLAKS